MTDSAAAPAAAPAISKKQAKAAAAAAAAASGKNAPHPVFGGPIASPNTWITFSVRHFFAYDEKTAEELKDIVEAIEAHLGADGFVMGAEAKLGDNVMFECLNRNPKFVESVSQADFAYPNLAKWFAFMKEQPTNPAATKVIDRTVSLQQQRETAKQQASASGETASKDQGSFEVGLPNVEAGVVTRFPPEPSGYLHIGHTKAALLNEYFARRYNGRLIVRFDDTNPSKEKAEFEEAILHDLELLKIKPDTVTWTSDSFEMLETYCVRMIEEGHAYVDDTVQEVMRQQRMDGVASACRDQSVEENLRRWEEMKKATDFGKTCCVRAKMSVDALNKALRDPVIYRVNEVPHARTGTKYKVYPTYDFACPIVDSYEGVTHALRTNEYRDRNDQYYWFIDTLKLRKPFIWDYSRMNFIHTLLSKRKLAWFVDNGVVPGWDDPRFPTVRGILRRGLTVETLKEYILMQGASKNILLLEWNKLWALNKKAIDPVAPRFTAINVDGAVPLTVRGLDAVPAVRDIPKHKKNPDVGTKKLFVSSNLLLESVDAASLVEGEEVTLMDLGNVIIKSITKDDAGVITAMEGDFNPEGDFKKTKKLTWLSKDSPLATVQLQEFGYLITKPKLEDEDNFEDFVNHDSVSTVSAFANAENIADLKVGDIIQFERKANFIVDKASDGEFVFILIPDGRMEK
ncbi:glutamyl-tRNA synthetase [Fonticula alba]|uniref:glutamate--tRNA ligase n=1 Tax=Fonticula alba TaxID=691883 RepID=A0A058ZD74_FONAL|nr:glutamyl-tRNA synthetase [Fonticula alba]KCV72360.1 glutamyl-tRNA synthetase [Fonticula alba]|eukprot:XP_009493938.1 glutamyl-tRNA synthetase [Fonticula alba]